MAGRGILKPMLRPGGRGLLPGAVSRRDAPTSARLSRLPTDRVGHAQAKPSIITYLLGAWQALHRAQSAIEIPEQAVR